MFHQHGFFTFEASIETALSDSAAFNELETNLAHYTRALGHPARVAVLLAIAKRGNRVEGETIGVPQLASATVLQHLRELKRAGIIQGRIFGAKSSYSIDMESLHKFRDSFFQFFTELQQLDE